jgi:hypothetical protein
LLLLLHAGHSSSIAHVSGCICLLARRRHLAVRVLLLVLPLAIWRQEALLITCRGFSKLPSTLLKLLLLLILRHDVLIDLQVAITSHCCCCFYFICILWQLRLVL